MAAERSASLLEAHRRVASHTLKSACIWEGEGTYTRNVGTIRFEVGTVGTGETFETLKTFKFSITTSRPSTRRLRLKQRQ